MRIINFICLLIFVSVSAAAQTVDQLIIKKEVERIEKKLSSDEMGGRKMFSPGINKAADFIDNEFKSAGLQTWKGGKSFKQQFELVRPKLTRMTASLNKKPLQAKNVIAVTSQPLLHVNQQSGYQTARIKPGTNLFNEAGSYIHLNKNYVVLVDTSFSKNFARLRAFLSTEFIKSNKNVVFILTNDAPKEYEIDASNEITAMRLSNVVGVIPGKTKPKEYVIFSAHYDHLGAGKAVNGDSIYNGANDDAAGTTAVIMLARYFKAAGNNERTLIFAAFTAEEIGGFGSQYFSRQFDAASVVAMFNIEMIGTESKWGRNSAYITGYDKTNMGSILEKNLKGTGFRFYPDPYPDQGLFYRSDNATLAKLGVPAHTISTSKMDNEKFYHTVDDEIETLDIENMTMIIKSIALSSRTIVSGIDTPTRISD